MTEVTYDHFDEIDEAQLDVRVQFIKELIEERGPEYRAEVDALLADDALVEDENFQKWMVCNLILEASDKDETNSDFNRMLYVMFVEAGNDLENMLRYYRLNTERDENDRITGFDITVLVDQEEIDG